ncbi:hypothetical protein SCHPADRAFT_945727 [Schizopora paradoxa]|uniref:Carbohydrate kinase PfkB domain-containing protein n=1 Tax=Schizopora paradoxa TaxID=27342 RepID=A0A0H2R4Z5_9AGAM|nr:hypothetical protein SCHPADRAFT_945727 [Schizopora paradoxa]
MSKLRKTDSTDAFLAQNKPRTIRIVASGTLFNMSVLTLPSWPAESSHSRARAVSRTRGGSVANVLITLSQFTSVEPMLVAPLAGNNEGAMMVRDLEREGVNTRFCKIWEGASVPSAWILESEETGSRTVINHNPLPDITHEEFVSLLGPLLVPENYVEYNTPTVNVTSPPGTPNSIKTYHAGGSQQNLAANSQSPAPFEWLHFEGRSVKTTLSNILGVDGLARERKWRSHCVFSLDICKVRQGVEALMPHADVIFLSKQYALAQNAAYTTPRPFLLALAATGRVPSHALLVAYWGSAGAALLSVPTREYFQSSGWVDDDPPPDMRPLSTVSDAPALSPTSAGPAVGSVRSGSGFWAAGHRAGSGTSSSAFTAFSSGMSYSHGSGHGHSGLDSLGGPGEFGMLMHDVIPEDQVSHQVPNGLGLSTRNGVGPHANGLPQIQVGGVIREEMKKEEKRDELAAQDAFVAGMIYALGQRVLPGSPFTPSAASYAHAYTTAAGELDKGRWRLEDCLRFASELAGRRARKRDFAGLADEMARAGWFD